MSGKRNAGSGKTKRSRKRGEKDIGLAESVDDYIFLDTYTGMRKMDEKDSTARQNLPVLGKRKKAVRARLRTGYTLEDFKTLFEKAEASEFLKGKNNRDWSATFDWLVCDSNMAKVLEGKYDRKENRNDTGRKAAADEEGYVKRLVKQGFGQEFEGF